MLQVVAIPVIGLIRRRVEFAPADEEPDGCRQRIEISFDAVRAGAIDYELDCRERPERPLPGGVISRPTAAGLGAALMAGGLALGAVVGAVVLGSAPPA